MLANSHHISTEDQTGLPEIGPLQRWIMLHGQGKHTHTHVRVHSLISSSSEVTTQTDQQVEMRESGLVTHIILHHPGFRRHTSSFCLHSLWVFGTLHFWLVNHAVTRVLNPIKWSLAAAVYWTQLQSIRRVSSNRQTKLKGDKPLSASISTRFTKSKTYWRYFIKHATVMSCASLCFPDRFWPWLYDTAAFSWMDRTHGACWKSSQMKDILTQFC